MSHHNDHGHGHNEAKPVSFTVPLILGAVTVLIILLFVSLGDPCHHESACAEGCSKECMEACAKGDHSKHPEGMSMEECHKGMEKHGDAHGACPECKDGKECAHHGGHAEEAVAATDSTAAPADTTHHAAEPAKEEAHH